MCFCRSLEQQTAMNSQWVRPTPVPGEPAFALCYCEQGWKPWGTEASVRRTSPHCSIHGENKTRSYWFRVVQKQSFKASQRSTDTHWPASSEEWSEVVYLCVYLLLCIFILVWKALLKFYSLKISPAAASRQEAV